MTAPNMRHYFAVSLNSFSTLLLLSLWTSLFFSAVDCRATSGVHKREAQLVNDDKNGLLELANGGGSSGSTAYSVGIQFSIEKGDSTVDRVINLSPVSEGEIDSGYIELMGTLSLPVEWDVDGAEIKSQSDELRSLENFEKRFVCYLTDSWGLTYKLDVQREREIMMPPTKKLTCIVVKPWVQKWVKGWKFLM